MEGLSLLLPNFVFGGTDFGGLSLLPPSFFLGYGFKVGGVVPAAAEVFLEVQMLEGLSLLLPNFLTVRI